MTNAELIARLRVDDPMCEEHFTANLAADRIEALSIANATLIAERDEALEWLSASQGYIADAVYALDKQEAAEAKLAKAVEALEYYAVEAMPWDADDSLIARATLAEIKERAMSDNDLIRRGDAKARFGERGLAFVRSGLDAIPAAQPNVSPDVAALVEALEQAKDFIGDQYACAESQALQGEYVSNEARPVWEVLCAALARVKGAKE